MPRVPQQSYIYHIGIDEVGRGPLAGPVTVCACAVLSQTEEQPDILSKAKDSKQMSAKKRVELFDAVVMREKKHAKKDLWYAIAEISAEIIDMHGIVFALTKAVHTALNDLHKKYDIQAQNSYVYLDGNLYAPKEYEQSTIIKGDASHPIISLASVLAKVHRDRYMATIAHQQYPQYGFEKHMGYGTTMHREMIKKYGLTPLHRATFCGNLL